jgi:hypothetical protein
MGSPKLQPTREMRAARMGAAAVAALACASAAHAIPVPGVQARATVQPSFSCADPGCAPVDNIVEGPTGPKHADAFAIGGFGGVGSATSDVDFGVMHLYSHYTNGGNAIAWGANRDLLTFTAPGVADGTFLDVTFGILVEGNGVQAIGSAYGRWQLQADLGGGFYDIGAFQQYDQVNGLTGNAFGLFTATVQVQSGFQAPLVIELTGASVSDTGGEAVADLVDTLYWGGVTNVSVGGVSVDNYTLTSASGTDWANSFAPNPGAVPEPAAWATMLLGFGGLGATLRARRSGMRLLSA